MDSANADALLICLVRSSSFRTIAMNRAEQLDLFDPLIYPGHAMVWDALRRLHKVIGLSGDISLFHLKEELKQRNVGVDEGGTLKDMLAYLEGIQDIGEDDISEPVASKYLEGAVVQALKVHMADILSGASSHVDLLKAINKTSSDVARATTNSETTIERPLLDPERFLPEINLVPSGVHWMDHLTGGGHRQGTLVGMLMPTGGGKTLTAVDLAVSQAKRGKHSLLFLYEQPIQNDVAERMFCRMFDDRDIDFFRKTRPDKWSKEDQERYRYLAKEIGPYVNVVDFSSKNNNGSNGIQDIEESLEAMKEADAMPEFVIVDWLWPMVTRYCSVRNIPSDSYRHVAFSLIDGLSQVAKKFNVVVVLMHQLVASMARANPNTIPTATDAAEIKSFPNLVDVCFVVGNRDKQTNVMWLCTDKNRSGQPQNLLGRMIGSRGVIELASNIEVDFRGRFVDKDKAVPEETEGDYNHGQSYL